MIMFDKESANTAINNLLDYIKNSKLPYDQKVAAKIVVKKITQNSINLLSVQNTLYELKEFLFEVLDKIDFLSNKINHPKRRQVKGELGEVKDDDELLYKYFIIYQKAGSYFNSSFGKKERNIIFLVNLINQLPDEIKKPKSVITDKEEFIQKSIKANLLDELDIIYKCKNQASLARVSRELQVRYEKEKKIKNEQTLSQLALFIKLNCLIQNRKINIETLKTEISKIRKSDLELDLQNK
jgi:hypothetical protein